MKDFENSLESMMNKAELLLINGVSDAKSYFHTPTISTFAIAILVITGHNNQIKKQFNLI